MRPWAWAGLATLCFVLAVACTWGAFTRFDDREPPRQGTPGFEEYEDERYAQARLSTVLGLAGAFALLGGAACAQRAWRSRAARGGP